MDLMIEFTDFGKQIKLYNNKYKSITDGIAISSERAEELIISGKAGIQVIKQSVIPYSIFMKALMNTGVTISGYGIATIDNQDDDAFSYNRSDIIELDNLWADQIHIDKIMAGMFEDDMKYVEYPKYEIYGVEDGKMRIHSKESESKSKIRCETGYINAIDGEDNMQLLDEFRKDHIIVNYTGREVTYCKRKDYENEYNEYMKTVEEVRRLIGK